MLSQVENYHPDLKAAISIILSSGGKRIRPIIVLLIGSMLGADQEKLATLGTAIELLHTATLVHDDLIDGSLLRRGIPTLNSKWSPAATILTGDFIFASAANMAARTQSVEIMEIFSRTLMTIVNGEVNQLFKSRCSANRDDYYQRIYAKTASLFETSAHTSAIISKAGTDAIQLLRKFGYELGMAFQIVDDMLDYSGDRTTIGKPVGGDLRQGLITLPMINFAESYPDNPRVKLILGGKCLDDDQLIAQLVAEVAESEAMRRTLEEAKGYASRAEGFLRELPDCPERKALVEITKFTVERRN
jgi:geranylgeranyl pyrophosphate synthase